MNQKTGKDSEKLTFGCPSVKHLRALRWQPPRGRLCPRAWSFCQRVPPRQVDGSPGSHTGEKTYDWWETKTNKKKLYEMEIYGKKKSIITPLQTQPLSFTFTSGLKLFWNSLELPSKSEVCLEVLRLPSQQALLLFSACSDPSLLGALNQKLCWEHTVVLRDFLKFLS